MLAAPTPGVSPPPPPAPPLDVELRGPGRGPDGSRVGRGERRHVTLAGRAGAPRSRLRRAAGRAPRAPGSAVGLGRRPGGTSLHRAITPGTSKASPTTAPRKRSSLA